MSFEDDAMTLFIDESVIELKELETQPVYLPKKDKPATCEGSENGACSRSGHWRRRNTAYNDEADNWVFMCDECFEVEIAYWQERWDEYYAGCM